MRRTISPVGLCLLAGILAISCQRMPHDSGSQHRHSTENGDVLGVDSVKNILDTGSDSAWEICSERAGEWYGTGKCVVPVKANAVQQRGRVLCVKEGSDAHAAILLLRAALKVGVEDIGWKAHFADTPEEKAIMLMVYEARAPRIDEARKALKESQSAMLLGAATRTIAQYGGREDIALLRGLMDHEEEGVREMAVWGQFLLGYYVRDRGDGSSSPSRFDGISTEDLPLTAEAYRARNYYTVYSERKGG